MNNISEIQNSQLKDLEDDNKDLWNDSFNLFKKKEGQEENVNSEISTGGSEGDIFEETLRPESPELNSSIQKRKKRKLLGSFKIKQNFILPSTSNTANLFEFKCIDSGSKQKSESCSSEGVISSIHSLIGEQNDLSWSSELQSPFSNSVVNYSNFNTEEKLTLIPHGFDNSEASDVSGRKLNKTSEDSFFNGFVSSPIGFSDDELLHHHIITDSQNKNSDLLDQSSTNIDKKCCRKLYFNSSSGQSFVNNKDDICDKSSPLLGVTEHCISPIFKLVKESLADKEDFHSYDDNIINQVSNSQGDDTLKSFSIEPSKNFYSPVFRNACDKSPLDNTFFKESSHEISFGVLEEICQASEIFSTNSQLNKPITPVSAKKSITKILTSTPVNCNFNKQNIECSTLRLPEKDVFFQNVNSLPVGSNNLSDEVNAVKNTENSYFPLGHCNQENYPQAESCANQLNIYSVIPRKHHMTSNVNIKSLQDILQSAKMLEDAEKCRKNLDVCKDQKIFKEVQSKTEGFLQFNDFKNNEPTFVNELEKKLASKNGKEVSSRNAAGSFVNKIEKKLQEDFTLEENTLSENKCYTSSKNENDGIDKCSEPYAEVNVYSITNTQLIRAGEEGDTILRKSIKNPSTKKQSRIQYDNNSDCKPKKKNSKKNILKKQLNVNPSQTHPSNDFKINRNLNENTQGIDSNFKTVLTSNLTLEKNLEEKVNHENKLNECNRSKNNLECLFINNERNVAKDKELISLSQETPLTDISKNLSIFREGNITEPVVTDLRGISHKILGAKEACDQSNSTDAFDNGFCEDKLVLEDELFIKNNFIDNGFTQLMNKFESVASQEMISECTEINGKNLKDKLRSKKNNETASPIEISFSDNLESKILDNSLADGDLDKVEVSEGLMSIDRKCDEHSEKELLKKSVSFSKNKGGKNINDVSKNIDNRTDIFSNCLAFSTASGKCVPLSKEAISKEKQLFFYEDLKHVKSSNKEDKECSKESAVIQKHPSGNFLDVNYEEHTAEKSVKSSRFPTKSVESVTLSKDSLLRAKSSVTEDNSYDGLQHFPIISNVSDTKEELPDSNNLKFAGFSCASGKSITVSKDALLKAKILFSETISVNEVENFPAVKKVLDVQEKVLTDNYQFEGFSTASGKPVNVSEDSLFIAKNLFKQDKLDNFPSVQKFDDEPDVLLTDGNCRFGRFSADKGMCLSVLNDAALNAPRLFIENEIENKFDSLPSIKEVEDISDKVLTDDVQCKGFSTASGKSVNISKDALCKAKKLFAGDHSFGNIQDYSSVVSKVREQETGLIDKIPSKFAGFSTASGKSVNVSEDALFKAKKLLTEDLSFDKLQDYSSVSKVEEEQETGLIDKIPSKFAGFSTASGKSVNVSKDALFKAKKLLTEDLSFDKLQDYSSVSKVEEEQETGLIDKIPSKFAGFSTASGKSVNVSKDALFKAKKLLTEDLSFDKLQDYSSVSKVEEEQETGLIDKIPSKFAGFSTASGKSVNVSEDALFKAKKLLAEDHSFDKLQDYSSVSKVEEEQETGLIDKIPLNFAGFSTASGKSVNVSKDALFKAKKLLTEDLSFDKLQDYSSVSKVEEEQETGLIDKIPSKFAGFSTASGKSVNVSKDALCKAKKLFAEDLSFDKLQDYSSVSKVKEEENTGLIDNIPLKFAGFSTASGMTVNVSREAVLKAQKWLTDDESPEMVNPCDNSGNFSSLDKADGSLRKDFLDSSFQFPSLSNVNAKSENSSAFPKLPVNSITKEQNLKNNNLSVPSKVSWNEEPSVSKKFVNDGLLGCKNRFKMANGECGKISLQSSSSKAKQLFVEVDKNCDDINKLSFINEKPSDTKKFNPESLNVNADFVSSRTLSQNVSTINTPKLSFAGFNTACGKSISVSKEALLKAQKLFDDNSCEVKKLSELDKTILSTELCNKNQSNFDVPLLSQDRLTAVKACTSVQQPTFEGEQVVPDTLNSSDKSIKNTNLSIRMIDDIIDLKQRDDSLKNHCAPESDSINVSLSVAHEVSESAAAFMFDEDTNVSDVPSWVQTYISSPSLINDRNSCKLSPIICNENEGFEKRKRVLSPILGSTDRFQKKRHVKKSLKQFTFINDESPITYKDEYLIQSPNLNQNFKTSTPINSDKFVKRKLNVDPNLQLPVAKKLKINDDSMLSQDDENLLLLLEVAEGRRRAAQLQNDLIIKSKIKESIRPCKGSLLSKKQCQDRIKLYDYVAGMSPQKYSENELLQLGIKKSVINVTSKNAKKFRFNAFDYYSAELCDKNVEGIPVGDGALVILDESGTAGVQEISRAFLASPYVCSSLISHKWVENYYVWIVWKLAAMERSFPTVFGNNCLTLENLMLQLKYRYDREIDECQRPSLRKILETDEPSARKIVVCVADTNNARLNNEIVVTDGWYSVTAIVDDEMVDLIRRRKVIVGTKLVIHGAELINCGQGCDPLEIGADVRLRIHTNSIRRARWNTRLGFWPTPGPLTVRLSSVLPKGGLIGKLETVVARTYPLVYKLKTDEGKNVLLSEKVEERESRLYELKHQQEIEKICNEIQREADSERSFQENKKYYKRMSNEEFQTVLSPEKLIRLTENSPDLQELLTEEQRDIIHRFHMEERERMHQTLQDRLTEEVGKNGQRVSIPMFKLRLVDPVVSSSKKCKSGVLTIWKPSEDVHSYLTEGAVVTFYNVSANGCRNGELQLTAGRQMKYNVKSHLNTIQRVVTDLNSLNKGPQVLQFSELDVVGIVVHISTSKTLQTVYIASTAQDLMGISFWGSIKNYGWESVVLQGSFLASSNLQWRGGTASWHIPSSYVTEYTYFTSNPKQDHLRRAMNCLKETLKTVDLEVFMSQCQDKLFSLLRQKESGGLDEVNPREGTSQHPMTSHSYSKGSELSASNDDFIITNALANKKALTQEKMKRLQCYGNPPPVIELPVLSSPLIKKEFKTPFRNVVKKNDSVPTSSDGGILKMGGETDL